MTGKERLRRLLVDKQELKAELARSEGEFFRLGIRGKVIRTIQRLMQWLGSRRDHKRMRISAPSELEFVATGKPTIIHLVPSMEVGGTGQIITDLAKYTKGDFEHVVVTKYSPTADAPYGMRALTGDPNYLRPFFAQAKENGPVLVHAHYWSLGDHLWYHKYFQRFQLWGIPCIETVVTPVEPYLSSAVREYVYVSDYVKNEFGLGEARETTVHPGFEMELFQSQPRKKEGETIGMVYRLETDKLNERALDPIIEILKARPKAKALIVGDGSLASDFEEKIKDAKLERRVEFTGTVPFAELPYYYADMDLFIAPVWRESFGLVVCYAMAAGVPVCGYDVGAVPEIVGGSKYLAPAENAEALARIAGQILDSPKIRAAMVKSGLERAKQFSVERMVRSYRSLYTRALYRNEPSGTISIRPKKAA